MKIMVLTPYLPHRQVGHGGGTAVRDLVASLARTHDVLVAALVRPGESDRLSDVEALGAEVAPIPFRDQQSRGSERGPLVLDRAAAFTRSQLTGYPYYVEKYWSSDVARHLDRLVADFQPDAIQIEYLQMSLYARHLRLGREARRQTGPRLVLNSHELGSLPRQRRAKRSGNPLVKIANQLEARAWRKLQVSATDWADTTLCVTPQDYDLYKAMGGKNLMTVPLGMDTEALAADWTGGPEDRFLFVGSFNHRPNRLAAELLTDRIWPLVTKHRPTAKLVLAGRGSREFLAGKGSQAHWESEQIEALGFVDDLAPHYRHCTLFVAPLPEGGGIKIKILEAMARGVPIVTTEVGAEGITTDQESALVISRSDDTFAQAVLDAAADQQAAHQRAVTARRLIEDRFSWAAITRKLTTIYEGA